MEERARRQPQSHLFIGRGILHGRGKGPGVTGQAGHGGNLHCGEGELSGLRSMSSEAPLGQWGNYLKEQVSHSSELATIMRVDVSW